MSKKIIETKHAPKPIGPYNQAVVHNGMVYISGQIAVHPESGKLILKDIQAETQQVLQNLKAVLQASNSSLDKVIKISIFLADMELFEDVNDVYSAYFEESSAPARECVAVKSLPKNVNVEISAIAFL